MQIMHLTELKSIEIALKFPKMSPKRPKTRQKFDFGMEPKITTLLPTCFWIIAMHSVCRCSLPVWRKSLLKKGTPVTYFCPALDPPFGGSCQKTTLVRDHEYFIPTKFRHNPSSCSGEDRLGYCFTPYQRLRLYNGAPFSRLLRHAGDTEDVLSA